MTIRRRSFLIGLTSTSSVLALGLVPHEAVASGGDLSGAINAVRERAEKSRLRTDRRAQREAERHAQRMAGAGRVFMHPDPHVIDTERRWGRVREVHGAGSSVRDLLARAQAHGPSRASLLGEFDAMAVATHAGEDDLLYAAIFLFRTADCAR